MGSMRKYLFGTGIIGAVTSGITLLRGMREEPFTWRTVLAWLSWGITLALAIGTISELNREARGIPVPHPEQSHQEAKILKRHR